MPIFEAELSDGRVVEIEGEHAPSEQDILAAVGSQVAPETKAPPQVSAGGAFGRAAGESLLPGIGAAAGSAALLSQYNPLAHIAPPYSEIGLGLLGAVGGGLAAGWGQKKLAQATLPEEYKKFEELKQADVEQQFLPSAVGELAGSAATFQLAPGQTGKGLYNIGRVIAGKTLDKAGKEAAVGAAIQLGLAGAQSTVQPLLEGETPTLKGVTKDVIVMGMLGHSRWKGLRPGTGIQRNEGPAATPEVMDQRKEVLIQKAKDSGKKLNFVEGELEGGKPTDVAHAEDDGSVSISLKNFNEWLDQDVPKGYDHAQAIENLVNHEAIHGVTPDDLATDFEKSLTKFQKWKYRRQYHGPQHEGPQISGKNLGKEALRYEVQLASEMDPSEYIAHTQEARATKFLDVLDRAADFFRSKARTTAQKAIVEKIKANVEAAMDAAKKGAQDALSIASPESAAQREVRTPMGEEAPLRQQGEVAPAQEQQAAPVAKDTRLPLTVQENRADALVKDPPVAKDVPEGSIHPDSIIPAIRLINGDVVHGWIKEDGTAATHPEIAKQYGITVEELDRKGWIRKDGRVFYEREPAAKGTGLPTLKKEGELHSTDKPVEKAPPVVAQEAQPRQAPAVEAETPAVAAAGEPAATPDISPAFPAVKMQELESLNREITRPDFKFDKKKYDRWIQLSEELDKAEAAAGPKPQGGEPLAMARKTASQETSPREIAKALGLRFDGTNPAFKAHSFTMTHMDGRPGTTFTLKEGSSLADAYQKYEAMRERWKGDKNPPIPPQWHPGDALAMSRKPEPDKIVELKPGAKANAFGHGYGSTYHATPEDWAEWQSVNTREMMMEGWPKREEIKNKYGGMPPSPPVEEAAPAAMSRKAALTPEQELARKVTEIVGGIGQDPQKYETVKQTVMAIAALPKDKWGPALTDFHFQWKAQEIAEADRLMASKSQKELDWELAQSQGVSPESLRLGELATNPEKMRQQIKQAFGAIDRTSVYKSAIWTLNQPVEAIPAPKASKKPRLLPAGGEAKDKTARPSYLAEKWKVDFLTDFRNRHPGIPEYIAEDVWNEAVNDVLSNASGERLKELLRPARLEKRYLGNLPGPSAEDPIDHRRVVPDADPQPILTEMAKAPDPSQSIKFKRFCAARDLTVEQGIEALRRLDAQRTEEIRQRNAMLEGTKAEITGPAGKKLAWATGTREAFGPGERADLQQNWREGHAINQKRRGDIINALSQWLIGPTVTAEKNPMRREIGLEDIWWDKKGQKGIYASYEPREGEDAGVIRSALKGLGGSVEGETASKLSRLVVVLVDRVTGDYHAVSAYIRQGQPMIYDPTGVVGSKEKGFLNVTQIMTKYRVAASMLVKDPLHRFQQKWKSEPGKTGEQKYKEEIGAVAKLKENAAQEQLREYQEQQEAERTEEERRQYEQRFEAEPAKAGEEAPLSIRKRTEQRRAEEHLGAWEEAADPDSIKRKRPIPIEDQQSIEAWMKGGTGRGPLGLFQTDYRTLANRSLSSIEAESIYGLFKELRIKHPLDFEILIQRAEEAIYGGVDRPEVRKAGLADVVKLRRPRGKPLSGRDLSALSGFSKIVNKVHEELRNSSLERKKMASMEPIPPDTDYLDMTPGQKEHYVELEAQKYRALLRSFNKIYELAIEAKRATASGAKAPAGDIPVPPDVAAFRTGALDKYGDSARRGVESAALSARPAVTKGKGHLVDVSMRERVPPTVVRGPEHGGIQLPSQFRGPQSEPYQQWLARYSRQAAGPGLQRAGVPPEMMPGAKYQETPPTSFRQPYERPAPTKGLPITGPPSNIQPGEFIRQKYGKPQYSGGFAPTTPSRHELLTGKPLGVDMPSAMTRKGVGPARRYQEELAKQGRRGPIPEDKGPVIPKEQLIAKGRDLVLSGKINPEREMRQFERTGYMSVDSGLAFRYWGQRLMQWSDAAAAEGPRSPAAKEAQARYDSWQDRLEKSSGEMFARTGHGLQGWNQIGPDDMQHTTFVKRFLKKAKAKAKGVKEEDYELTDEDEEQANAIAREVKKRGADRSDLEMSIGNEATKATNPVMDEGNKKAVSNFDKIRKQKREQAAAGLRAKKPGAAMAMKGEQGELPPLDRESEDFLGNIGMDVMAELSKANDMTDARWIEEMKKVISSEEIGRPDLEPYLPHIRAVAEEIRNIALNNFIGTGDAVKDARSIFTRKRPPIEESMSAIQRALEADPTGKKITPAEAFHIWNYLRTRFFDKGILDFRKIRTEASAELGIKDDTGKIVEGKEYSQLRLFRAMAANRTMRKMSEDLIIRIRDESRVKDAAVNWLKNQEYPQWLRTARAFPRWFFWDKILGHSTVPMITHAPTMIFNPMAWSVYFGHYKNGVWHEGAWQKMYKMTGLPTEAGQKAAKIYHEGLISEMVDHERFNEWKEVGLQHDPFKHTDDYQIEGLQKVLGEKMGWLTGGRGFDALKLLRYAMAEKWLASLPEHLRNKESMSLIADSVNHATGIVKTNFHESLNWLMFAPKLEASRWAYLFKDTVKAADIARKWKTSSMEQRAWAKSELMQKASMVGMYYGFLALNQAFLKMTGSDQDINFKDPSKPDFMSFKVAGFKVGLASPIIGMVKMMARVAHDAFQERTKFEKLTPRQKAVEQTLMGYARGKASPFTSFGLDAVTAQDYASRPIGFLPWSEPMSRRKRLAGETPYAPGEYALQTFSPIPLEEAFKNIFKQGGMSEIEASELLRTLIIAGGMSATGARLSEIEK